MGKRKNKQKDEDRIVQRRRIKKEDPNKPPEPLQEQVEEENGNESDSASIASEDLEKLIELEENNQAEEKSKVQKFMEKFKIEGEGEAETQDHRKRLSKMADKISLIEDAGRIGQAYSEFFNLNKDTLISTKLQELEKERAAKQSDKEVLREKMKEIFNLNNDDGEEINPYKKHEEQKKRERELAKTLVDPVKAALNNNVELKEYALKKALLEKKPYSVENVAEYVVDESAAQCIAAAGGLNKSTANLHASIPAPAPLTQAQQIQFAVMNNYHDLVAIDPEESNSETFRTMYAAHIMNHLTKIPLRKEGEDADEEEEAEEEKKKNSKDGKQQADQEDEKYTGYTNCKVVIIAPFKGDAVGIVNELLKLYGEKKLKKNSRKERFEVEYEDPERAEEDDFRIAISITSKGLKLFTPFATCDIIVTSLIGLRMATSAKEESSNSNNNKNQSKDKSKGAQGGGKQERDFSFLSSVEILVIDRAHALYMQNWQHMHELMRLFNRVPKHKSVTNSIHKIREYFFENLSRFYRQTIVYSEFAFAELNALKAKHMTNHRGCLTSRAFYPQLPHTKFNQEFVKFEVKDLQNEMDERLAFFKQKIWDDWNKEEMDRSVIFVSSYFEYLKLKSMFVKQNAPVFGICEYTKKRDVQKRISLFRNNTLPYLMQTERAYFFDVGSVRGMKNILFYSLPKNAFIYQEMISYLDQAAFKQSKCRVACLFNKYDAHALERIVGTENAKELLATYNKATSFVL